MAIVVGMVWFDTPEARLQVERGDYLVKKIFAGVQVRTTTTTTSSSAHCRWPLHPLSPHLASPIPRSPRTSQDKPETVKEDLKEIRHLRELEGAVGGEHLHQAPRIMPPEFAQG